MTCGIYSIIGHRLKLYIGQSVDIENRWVKHRNQLRRGTHPCRHLLAAWQKHGEDAFSFVILEECAPDKLDELEAFYIENAGGKFYNVVPAGAGRTTRGLKWTEEQRANMSVVAKARGVAMLHTPEARAKKSEKMKGRKPSETCLEKSRAQESREKAAAKMRGQKRPDLSKWVKDNLTGVAPILAIEASRSPEARAKRSASAKTRPGNGISEAVRAAAYTPEAIAKGAAKRSGENHWRARRRREQQLTD